MSVVSQLYRTSAPSSRPPTTQPRSIRKKRTFRLVARIQPPAGAPTYFHYDGRLNRYCIDLAGTQTYYLWDGLNQLEERNADGSLKARYTHGGGKLPAIGTVVEIERHVGAATYYQYGLGDHRGTFYKITDQNQDVQIDYTLDAFGRQIAAPGGADPVVPNELIYQTNWLTLNIGGRAYCLSKYRIYDSALGIFLSRDFLPFLNKYRAWSNNPVMRIDVDGDASIDLDNPAIHELLQQLRSEDRELNYRLGTVEFYNARLQDQREKDMHDWHRAQLAREKKELQKYVSVLAKKAKAEACRKNAIRNFAKTGMPGNLSLADQNLGYDLRQAAVHQRAAWDAFLASQRGEASRVRGGAQTTGGGIADAFQGFAASNIIELQRGNDSFIYSGASAAVNVFISGIGDLFRVGTTAGERLGQRKSWANLSYNDVLDIAESDVATRAAGLFTLFGSGANAGLNAWRGFAPRSGVFPGPAAPRMITIGQGSSRLGPGKYVSERGVPFDILDDAAFDALSPNAKSAAALTDYNGNIFLRKGFSKVDFLEESAHRFLTSNYAIGKQLRKLGYKHIDALQFWEEFIAKTYAFRGNPIDIFKSLHDGYQLGVYNFGYVLSVLQTLGGLAISGRALNAVYQSQSLREKGKDCP